MSQIFDYFVCSRPLIERWADALVHEDEELQHTLEHEMPRFISLRNVGDTEFNILAGCVGGGAVDEVDLVRAISEEEGPWITVFRRTTVELIAGMSVDQLLLQRWVEAVAEFNGLGEDRAREILTHEVAESLKDISRLAVHEQLDVFTCFYG